MRSSARASTPSTVAPCVWPATAVTVRPSWPGWASPAPARPPPRPASMCAAIRWWAARRCATRCWPTPPASLRRWRWPFAAPMSTWRSSAPARPVAPRPIQHTQVVTRCSCSTVLPATMWWVCTRGPPSSCAAPITCCTCTLTRWSSPPVPPNCTRCARATCCAASSPPMLRRTSPRAASSCARASRSTSTISTTSKVTTDGSPPSSHATAPGTRAAVLSSPVPDAHLATSWPA